MSLVATMNNCRGIDGWYAWSVLNPMLCELDNVQHEKSDIGAIGEIGIHHGRMFIPMLHLLKSDEIGTAIDLFDNQEENIDNSGKGSFVEFWNNCKVYLPSSTVDRIHTVNVNSKCLRAEDFSHRYRLFSIDGGHTCETVMSDLELVVQIMTEYGVIIVDDFWHTGYEGVWQATSLFLGRATTNWAPFYVSALCNGSNKLMLCRKKHVDMFFNMFKGKHKNMLTSPEMSLGKPSQDLVNSTIYNSIK